MRSSPIALAAVVLLFARSGNALAAADRPLNFEENRGQADARVKFLVRSAHGALFLKTNEAVLLRRANTAGPAALRMQFIGADPAARIAGVGALPGQVKSAAPASSTARPLAVGFQIASLEAAAQRSR